MEEQREPNTIDVQAIIDENHHNRISMPNNISRLILGPREDLETYPVFAFIHYTEIDGKTLWNMSAIDSKLIEDIKQEQGTAAAVNYVTQAMGEAYAQFDHDMTMYRGPE